MTYHFPTFNRLRTGDTRRDRPLLIVGLLTLATGAATAEDFAGQTIQEIQIEGLKHTRVVREQMHSQVGASYDPETSADDVERLDRLGIFSAIDIHPEAMSDGVLLRVTLRETLGMLPYPSIGINDENGVSAGAGVKFGNLAGRAISASVSARFGGLTDIEILLQSPHLSQPGFWYDVELFHRDRENRLVFIRENVQEGTLRFGRWLNERFRVGGQFLYTFMMTDQDGITLSGNKRDRVRGLGAVAEYDSCDLRSNPHEGWKAAFDVTQNGGVLGGSGDFVRTNVDVRRYQPLSTRHTVAFFSFLTSQTGRVGEGIPVYMNLYLGGTNSVRGWDLNARHGKNQFLNTLEYRYDLLKPRAFRVFGLSLYGGLQVAAFADTGTVWDEGDQFAKNFIGGGGAGLRLIVPFIDMIRIDIGFGQSHGGPFSHIGIREKADYHRRRVR